LGRYGGIADGSGGCLTARRATSRWHLEAQKTTRNRLLNLLKIAVSLGGLLAIVLTQDLEQVLGHLRDMNWLLFGMALLLFLAGSLVRAYRWGTLVWSLGIQVSWWRLVALYFVGSFFSLFLPTGLGGDAVKMYELSRDDGKAAEAISSVVVDRFVGLFVLFSLAVLALIGGYRLVGSEVLIAIAGVFVACLIALTLLLQRRWIETWGRRLGLDRLLGRIRILRELYASVRLYRTVDLLRATAASVVWNLMLIFGNYLLGLAVGVDLSLYYYFLFIPIISVLLMLPSIGGLGIREGAYVLLFSQVGVANSQALALAFAFDVVLLINGLIGALIYLAQGMREVRQ
jgi:uncharacterized protein (TIRG00374 family)